MDSGSHPGFEVSFRDLRAVWRNENPEVGDMFPNYQVALNKSLTSSVLIFFSGEPVLGCSVLWKVAFRLSVDVPTALRSLKDCV